MTAATLVADGIWLDTDGPTPVFGAGGLVVTADRLRMEVGGPIGSAAQPFALNVDRVSLSTRTDGAGIFLASAGDVTVGGGLGVKVYRPDGAGGVQTLGGASAKGLDSAGDLVLDAAGTITVDASGGGVVARDNVRLSATGVGTDVILGADVRSDTGHVTVQAADDLAMLAGVDVMTAGAGSFDLRVGTGSLTMAASATLSTVD